MRQEEGKSFVRSLKAMGVYAVVSQFGDCYLERGGEGRGWYSDATLGYGEDP